MNFNPSFLHLRNITPTGEIDSRGGITVAFRETSPGTIEFASAYCSPVDNFSKAYGRIKATGRLNSDRFRGVAKGRDLMQFRRAVLDGDFTI